MTLTLELTPEEAQRVTTAQAKGIDVLEMLHSVIASLPQETTATSLEELDRFFEEMTEGSENLPVLAPEATTRAAIYAEHD